MQDRNYLAGIIAGIIAVVMVMFLVAATVALTQVADKKAAALAHLGCKRCTPWREYANPQHCRHGTRHRHLDVPIGVD